MSADARKAALRLVDAGYFPVPLEYQSKSPVFKDWQHIHVTHDNFNDYFPESRNLGVGLLLGTEPTDGVFVAAVDVDLEDDLLIARTRLALPSLGPEKRGAKGVTIIVRTETAIPKRMYKRKDANGDQKNAVEILGSRIQTVLPPSIHPQTRGSYIWLGEPLHTFRPERLPLLDSAAIDEIVLAVKDPESPFFEINEMSWFGPGGGGTVDDAVLHASAVAVSRNWTDDQITRRINRAVSLCLVRFPESAPRWDGAMFDKRLAGMIADARAKGFEKAKKPRVLPKGERRIEAVNTLTEQLGGLDMLWRDATELRRYEDGHWPVLDQTELQYRSAHLDLSWIEASDAETIVRTVFIRSPNHKYANPDRPLICLKNGTLDVNTMELHDWNKEDVLTAKLPFEYDERAECPVYDALLRNIFSQDNYGKTRDDGEIQLHVDLFNEFFGLTLVDDLSFGKMLVIKGPTGCGKSTLANVVKMLHDPRVIASTPLHKMTDERYLSSLVGKLVSVSGEIPPEAYVSEDVLKSLITGDGVTVRKLYEEPLENVTMRARFMQTCNELFRVRDSSGAVERRLIILETRSSIPEDLQDKDLDKKLKLEMPGILLRAVAGLRRLRERGRFEQPVAAKHAKERFSEESNHLMGWLRERTHQGQKREDANYVIPNGLAPELTTDLYADYKEWSEMNGHRTLSSVTWGSRLATMGFPAEVTKVGTRSVRTRYINRLKQGEF